MKKVIKAISIFLVILMFVSILASCQKPDDTQNDNKLPENNDSASTTVAGETGEVTTAVPDIEVRNWDGKEFRILGRTDTELSVYTWAQHFEVWREEVPEDVVGKAVWDRNFDILKNYGIDIVGYLKKDYNSVASTTLDAGEDLYDLMLLAPEKFHPLALKGQLTDLNSLENINMAHPAWMEYPNEQLSMGGKLYYTTNKFLLQDKNRCWLFFYNRDMAEELKLGRFEEFVFSGDWTIDKVLELGKQATFDSDGQPGMNKFDNWGVAVAEFYSFSQIAYGVGFSFTQKGADGYPTFIGPSDDMMRRLDKAYTLTGNLDVYFCDQMVYGGKVDYNDCAYHIFYDGRALLHPGVLSQLDTMPTKCEFEYAPLPNPKFDEKQELYHSIPNLGNGSLLGVPSTIMDRDFVGYALELLSEKSLHTTYDAYIENKCLLQNVVDQDAANCLRLVFEGITYDIAFVSDIGGFGSMMRNTLGTYTNNTFDRLYSRSKRVAEKALEDIRAAYEKIEN